MTRVTEFSPSFPNDGVQSEESERAEGEGGDHGSGGYRDEGRLGRVTNALTSARDFEENGNITGTRGYCAAAFGVKEQGQESGIALLEEYGHPGLDRLVSRGYQMITFSVDVGEANSMGPKSY